MSNELERLFDLNLLQRELLRDEGLRLKPYKDTVGKTTIGIGRNLDDVGISEVESFVLLNSDIIRTVADLDKYIPWWRGQTEPRRRAMLNMAFNMGIGGLLTFKNTLSHWENGRYKKAARGILWSKYARQVGNRAKRVAELVRGDS